MADEEAKTTKSYPTVGRTVHYHYAGGVAPLLVNECSEDGRVTGHVFPARAQSFCVEVDEAKEGNDPAETPGWVWPPRV